MSIGAGLGWCAEDTNSTSGALQEVPQVLVVRIANVLQVARDDGAGLPRDRQQVPPPIGQVEHRQPGAGEDLAGDGRVDGEAPVPAAVVEADPGTVRPHQVDASTGAGRVDGQAGQVDAVGGQLGPHPGSERVITDMADERGRQAQPEEPAAGVPAGLAQVVDVLGEMILLRQVRRPREVHIGVDSDIANDDDFGIPPAVHAVQSMAGAARCQWTKHAVNSQTGRARRWLR